jgi:hypothetical protein
MAQQHCCHVQPRELCIAAGIFQCIWRLACSKHLLLECSLNPDARCNLHD